MAYLFTSISAACRVTSHSILSKQETSLAKTTKGWSHPNDGRKKPTENTVLIQLEQGARDAEGKRTYSRNYISWGNRINDENVNIGENYVTALILHNQRVEAIYSNK